MRRTINLAGSCAVVTGGAGFLGSHLCERLLYAGARVIAIDNLSTGNAGSVANLFGHERFRFLRYDVTDFIHVDGDVDFVLHWASPASPADYLRLPIQTLEYVFENCRDGSRRAGFRSRTPF